MSGIKSRFNVRKVNHLGLLFQNILEDDFEMPEVCLRSKSSLIERKSPRKGAPLPGLNLPNCQSQFAHCRGDPANILIISSIMNKGNPPQTQKNSMIRLQEAFRKFAPITEKSLGYRCIPRIAHNTPHKTIESPRKKIYIESSPNYHMANSILMNRIKKDRRSSLGKRANRHQSRTKMPMTDQMKKSLNFYVPNWLYNNKNFTSVISSNFKYQSLYYIFCKSPEERDEIDCKLQEEIFRNWFPYYSLSKIKELIKLCSCHEFEQDHVFLLSSRDLIMILRGELELCDDSGNVIAKLECGKILADHIFMNKNSNTSKAVVVSNTLECLIISHKNFANFLDEVERKHFEKRRSFFKALELTQYWSYSKLLVLIQAAEQLSVKANELVFDLNSADSKFYFVVKGSFFLSTTFDLKDHFKYPTGLRKWEMMVTTRKMLQPIEQYSVGSSFGHMELFEGGLRTTQIRALTKGKLYYIERPVFLQLFDSSETRSDFEAETEKLISKIQIEISQKEIHRKHHNSALLDAMRLNPPSKGLDLRNKRCEEFINKKQKKLLGWIHRLQKVSSHNSRDSGAQCHIIGVTHTTSTAFS